MVKENIIYLSEDSRRPVTVEEKIFAYLDLLVYKRNEVAHQYDISEVYNLKQIDAMRRFTKELTFILYEFCISQVIIKMKQCNKRVYRRIMPVKVIKGSTSLNSAILHVRNISTQIISKQSIFMIYDPIKKIYCISNILKIMSSSSVEVEEMYPCNDYSIELLCNVPLHARNKKLFNLSVLDSSSETYMHSVQIK